MSTFPPNMDAICNKLFYPRKPYPFKISIPQT